MTKTDQILEHIIDMKGDIGGINQHLKNLNARVQSHAEDIKEIHTKISKVRRTVAKISGTVSIIVIGVGAIIGKWLDWFK